MYACLYTRAHAYSYSHARALCACVRAMARTQQSHAVVLQEPYDEEKTQLMEAADASGKILRFVGIVDVEHQTCEVKLEQFPKTHAFAGTQWADNIVAFHTAVCVYNSVHVSITVSIYLQQCPHCAGITLCSLNRLKFGFRHAWKPSTCEQGSPFTKLGEEEVGPCNIHMI